MRLIAIALLLLPLAAQAQVMRCPDGSYQSRCSGGQAVQGGGVSSYSAPAPPRDIPRHQPTLQRDRIQAPRSTHQRAQSAPQISRNDLVKARSRGIILMGMEERDVVHILGRPHTVDVETGSRRSCRHLFWKERGLWSDYVRLCDGRVDYHRKDNQ